MMKLYNVAIVVGSLRKESINRKLANALVELAPPSLDMAFVGIGGLPLFNEDEETRPPAAWTSFREEIRQSDAVLFVTPEYNRSVPGGLKNAVDVGSRPYGQSVWNAKPAAVISASPSAVGGFGANHHLRQALTTLNMPTMPAPEAYIGGAAKLFNAEGKLASEDTRRFLQNFMTAFEGWIATNAPV